MSIALITGSSGLIGSESAQFFHDKGWDILGIDNDLRSYFFGKESSTAWNTQRLKKSLKRFTPLSVDIRNQDEIFKIFKKYGSEICLVIHTAAQPSHDWAAREPFTDFTVNANGTLVLLEATRQFCPEATFIFTSTNKVYG
ncbi:MAG: NAD-dependent epimerase/dehydratase family protein, partial [Deltaproteobacteria bacterium]|nr:NAD-dependent epimerase/dehydratase family protein [Deltaproteobacteria bacterium]